MLKLTNFNCSLLFFLFVFICLEVVALGKDSHYVYDIPMCMLLLALVYYFKAALFLHIVHFVLFAIFLVVHCLGLFDAYLLYPFGIEYDYWVHAYFGLVSALIIYRWMRFFLVDFHSSVVIVFTLLFILGISSLHELYEYFGALLLGEGEGVLFIGAGDLDQWDTQKDMLNNVIGGLLGLLCLFLSRRLSST